MEFLILFVAIIIGVSIGWKLREAYATYLLTKVLGNVEENLKKVSEDSIHINIEKHNDTFYVYDKSTNQFMAQGSTKEELEDVLKERFPGKHFACNETTLRQIGFIS